MSSDRDTSSIVIFVALSLLIHIAAAVALYLLAPEGTGPEREEPYVVSLVPEELQPPPPEPPAEQKKTQVAKRPTTPLRRMPRIVEPPPKDFDVEAGKPEEPAKREPAKQERDKREGGTTEAKEGATPPLVRDEPVSEKPGFQAEPPLKEKKESEGLGKKLFDKDVLAKVIEEGKEEKPDESSVTFDTKEVRRWGYMQRLKDRIEYVWEYPREAALRGIYGDLVVKFVIKKDGELGAVELVRTSGWQNLDKAAMQALRDGAPYWPLPDDWDSSSLTVTGHFIYTLEGSYYIR